MNRSHAGDADVALEAVNVTMEFGLGSSVTNLLERRVVHAVSDVSLALLSGAATALVGESGSGKSTLGRLLAGLYRPTHGEIRLDSAAVDIRSLRAFRRYAKEVQLILQDPYASLNPHRTIAYHITRPLRIHGYVTARTPRAKVREEVFRLLEQVGLTPADSFYHRFPHELSGGQRQRASIARALAARPRILIADEPVSMLDVSLRRGILELLKALQENGLTILYITHDLPSAAYFADTIAVMYAGKIVEQGPARQVIDAPAHPYTQLLLSATPDPFALDDAPQPRLPAQGEPPSLIDLPAGCAFHPRCPHAFAKCREITPPPIAVAGEQWASCWLREDAGGTDDVRSKHANDAVAGIHPSPFNQ